MDQQFRNAESVLDSAIHNLTVPQQTAVSAQTKLDGLLERSTAMINWQEIETAKEEVAAAQKEVAAAIRQLLMTIENYKTAAHLLADQRRSLGAILPLSPEDPLRKIKNTMCHHPVSFGGRTWSRLRPKIRRQVLAHVMADALCRKEIDRTLRLIDAPDFHQHCMHIHLPSVYINVPGKVIKLKTLSGHVLMADSAEIYSALEKRGVDYFDVLRGAGSVLANPRRQWCPLRKISYIKLPPVMETLALSFAATRIRELTKTNAALGDPKTLMEKIDRNRFCSMLVESLFAEHELRAMSPSSVTTPDKVLDFEIKLTLKNLQK